MRARGVVLGVVLSVVAACDGFVPSAVQTVPSPLGAGVIGPGLSALAIDNGTELTVQLSVNGRLVGSFAPGTRSDSGALVDAVDALACRGADGRRSAAPELRRPPRGHRPDRGWRPRGGCPGRPVLWPPRCVVRAADGRSGARTGSVGRLRGVTQPDARYDDTFLVASNRIAVNDRRPTVQACGCSVWSNIGGSSRPQRAARKP